MERHAVVLGGSMAGLSAARVLAEHFERVTLVERDRLPDGAEPRAGVPQGRHTHGLLGGGAQVLEGLLPGLCDELAARLGSAPITGLPRYVNNGLRACPVAPEVRGALASRPLLEWHVRRRVLDLPNVALIEGHAARGLLAGADRRRVTGVHIAPRDDRTATRELTADLVVDATGRGSRAPRWLGELGYRPPAEERVEVELAYATRFFRRSAGDLDGSPIVNVAAVPPNRRMGIALAVEDDRWIVTMAGMLGERPPADLDGFTAFAACLPVPDIAELISRCEPLGDAALTRFPAHVRWRYERMRSTPDGFVVLGDALSCFNPVYGQGMSVAAQEALALGRCVGEPAGMPRRFYAAIAPIVDAPWDIAVGNDLRFPEVVGPRPLRLRLINRYVRRVHAAAVHDPVVTMAFLRVAHLLAPPPTLLAPRIAARVLAPRAGG